MEIMDPLMKKLIVLLTLSTLSSSVLAQETSWLDSLKNLVGLGEAKEQTVEAAKSAMPSADGLVGMLTSGLFPVQRQKSLMQKELIGQMPDLSKLSSGSEDGIGGLLNKASEYSDSLKAINDVKNQFEALGLKPEMISNFITTAQSYLNTEQGQQAKKLLTEGLGKLLG